MVICEQRPITGCRLHHTIFTHLGDPSTPFLLWSKDVIRHNHGVPLQQLTGADSCRILFSSSCPLSTFGGSQSPLLSKRRAIFRFVVGEPDKAGRALLFGRIVIEAIDMQKSDLDPRPQQHSGQMLAAGKAVPDISGLDPDPVVLLVTCLVMPWGTSSRP